MTTNGFDERTGRETRLLVLVVIIALGVLVLLARFRFPAADMSLVSTTAGPLAGLAARATFDDMAATIVGLLNRVSPSIIVVRLEAIELPPPARSGGPASSRSGGTPASRQAAPPAPVPEPRLQPALRVRADLALVLVPPGMRPVPAPGLVGPVEIVVHDATREIALVRIVTGPETSVSTPSGIDGFTGLSYAGLVEATMGGATMRPVFIGRVDPSPDNRWPRPLFSIGRSPDLGNGTFLFAIDGRLIGMVVGHGDGVAIVPRVAIEAVVVELTGAGAGGS